MDRKDDLCQWDGCDQPAVCWIGTALIPLMRMCEKHRDQWYGLSYREMESAADGRRVA